MPKIIFVDEKDNVIGSGTRAEALEKGIIHRIVRIFLFNSKGELLIQKRSRNVLSPGKWDQSIGGHVDEGEDYFEAAKRELAEELGIQGTKLEESVKFYTDKTDDTKIEKRFNTLYLGNYDGEINFNPEEISEIQWITLDKLANWMEEQPEDFTQGFIKTFNLYLKEQAQPYEKR